MCGIVGLLIKNPDLRGSLGAWATQMLHCMSERGPDSAGLATFASLPTEEGRQFSLLADDANFDWDQFVQKLDQDGGEAPLVKVHQRHALLVVEVDPAELSQWLAENYPQLHLLSVGRSIQVYKDEGTPAEVAERYG